MSEVKRWRITVTETRETVYYLTGEEPTEVLFAAGERHAAERIGGAKREIRFEPATE